MATRKDDGSEPQRDKSDPTQSFVAVGAWQEWIIRLSVTLLTLAAIWSVFGEDFAQLAAPAGEPARTSKAP